MRKKILLVLAIAAIALVGFIATRPSASHVERSLVVPATPAVVYGYIHDLKHFSSFSPWLKVEPTAKVTVDGGNAGVGVGARYAWVGREVGAGEMTIASVKENERIELDLHFMTPFESQAKVIWSLVPEGSDQTKVTWAMDSTNTFMGKAFGLVVDMDEMLGRDFSAGLEALAPLVGAAQKAADEVALQAAKAAAAALDAATVAAPATP
jgi:ribosome-associated toxin RatA of RatAB toxin-antitoxin module